VETSATSQFYYFTGATGCTEWNVIDLSGTTCISTATLSAGMNTVTLDTNRVIVEDCTNEYCYIPLSPTTQVVYFDVTQSPICTACGSAVTGTALGTIAACTATPASCSCVGPTGSTTPVPAYDKKRNAKGVELAARLVSLNATKPGSIPSDVLAQFAVPYL